jgi:hypothetical protein
MAGATVRWQKMFRMRVNKATIGQCEVQNIFYQSLSFFYSFGEFNKELLEFIGKISESIAAQHHRKLGFKSELGGRSRAKAGIIQRISMVALRATARQVIRGVALVGAANVQAHSDRRAEKTAEAAKYDAFGPKHGGAFRPFDCGRAA